ncbi:MAG: murein L,D-transpeptidase [Alphaproteobacteria bacterium]|jgi:murein L,D-transpeptidase YafK|nr:MAG: murein L,D-transpeptidase [Alphaproteobacteria bacterium]
MRVCSALMALATACLLASCAGNVELAAHLRPLPTDTMMLLGKKGMDVQAPIFVRIFKEESELELWKQRDDGHFYHFKTYPICNWSGDLGPKVRYGDRQAPEGFYTITREQMNPDSKYHLALNLGYPNAFDRAWKRNGDFLMIHGSCKSAGCYAMTDALIEEIYAIARESFIGGSDSFQVHAYPFRMTDQNMARFASHEAYPFWQTMKEGYDYFELTRKLPTVAVCNRRYVVNVALRNGDPSRLDPEGTCPAFVKPKPDPFRPKPGEQFAEQRIVVPGQKMRSLASVEDGATRSGLTSTGSLGGLLPNMSFAPGK